MNTTVVWLRQDLRLEDHPALYQAAQEGKVVPLFIWSPEDEGAWPAGSASRVWLHYSLEKLTESLKEKGLKLILRKGPYEKTLKLVMEETQATRLYWSRRFEPERVKEDARIKAEIRGAKSFDGALLFEPWKLAKSYQVFTPFYKAVLQLTPPEKPLPAIKAAQGVDIPSLTLDALELLPAIHWEKGIVSAWTPGEKGALKQLAAFDPIPYPELRDRPDLHGVSRLSPHLHFGEISPRKVWHTFAGREGAEPFLRQLVWREFAHHILYHHPETPLHPLRKEWENYTWQGSEQDLKRWQQGETGYPIVDAGMRELWTTGWMHNRVRMIVGSFLVKDLQVSWLHGAKWFWDTLVDADLANNTLGWQWVGGCGADAAPYFRIFNPTLQGQKFDPEGNYVKKWLPELKNLSPKVVHTPWVQGKINGYPERMIDHEVARKRALRYKEFL